MSSIGRPDLERVGRFLESYMKGASGFLGTTRAEELERRIRQASELTLADKVELVKRLAPRKDRTDIHEELRLAQLIQSIEAADLPAFKFALDYDGDYKDLEEYVFHDIDDEEIRDGLVEHLAGSDGGPSELRKVLTDVDDTLFANLVDERYPKGTFYPGALEFYDALWREQETAHFIPVTTLSARPNPVAGTLEEGSLRAIQGSTQGRLRPSALSGRTVSSILGTLETVSRAQKEKLREDAGLWKRLLKEAVEHLPSLDRWERRIGDAKYGNFLRYAKIYPEYEYVFLGDSGQADALTAYRMVHESLRGSVRATFLHDVGHHSPTYTEVNETLDKSSSEERKKVVVFRNHIDAAIKAYSDFDGLITTESLARVTQVALREFLWIPFGRSDSERRSESALREEFRADATLALETIAGAAGADEELKRAATQIDELLDSEAWSG